MKLIILMSLNQNKNQVRKLFEKHRVQIYSEIEIKGHTLETIRRYGWWVFEKDGIAIYSTLFFAVVPKEKADEVMENITCLAGECDPDHPIRAFQIDVERMV
ncbi:MAG: hypothetical protein ACE5HX_04205 [bacterium]